MNHGYKVASTFDEEIEGEEGDAPVAALQKKEPGGSQGEIEDKKDKDRAHDEKQAPDVEDGIRTFLTNPSK